MIQSAEEFYRLRVSDNPEDYRRAAHDSASEAVWRNVIRQYPDMKKWVVHNKTVPIPILELLAEDADEEVRWFVATKRKLTLALFEKLAKDSNESVRVRLISNKKVPLSVLEALSQDSVAFVRESALETLAERQKT